MDFKDKLLEILICPQCKQSLKVAQDGVICENCNVMYPFTHGIRAMFANSAIKLDTDENTN